MDKYLLVSIMVANAVIPAFFASDPNARRGLRRAIAGIVGFNLLYLLAVLFLYPQLVH